MIRRDNSADFFNKLGTRNAQNTRVFEYNCGGYALNTFSWYCPHNIGSDRYYSSYTEKGMQKTTQNAVAFMLKEFSDLRVIKDIKELAQDEYAIAFRIGGVNGVHDFHFMKRAKQVARIYDLLAKTLFLVSSGSLGFLVQMSIKVN